MAGYIDECIERSEEMEREKKALSGTVEQPCSDGYIPFGDAWRKDIKRNMTKDGIIEMLRGALIKINQAGI